MTEQEDAEQLLHRSVRECLDAGTENLDPQVVARLAEIRQQALASPGQTVARGWLAAAGLSLAVVLAVAIWLGPVPGHAPPGGFDAPAPLAATDLEWLLVEDDPELFENLEFYYWLDEQDAFAG